MLSEANSRSCRRGQGDLENINRRFGMRRYVADHLDSRSAIVRLRVPGKGGRLGFKMGGGEEALVELSRKPPDD